MQKKIEAKMDSQKQIAVLEAEILDLTFERAFSPESQRTQAVWESLQKQIEEKQAKLKQLRAGKPTFTLGE